ncbi:MAG: hypothetical protein R2827_08940 [Bdellovibrionales bacterium]
MNLSKFKKIELFGFFLLIITGSFYLYSNTQSPTYNEALDGKIVTALPLVDGGMLVSGHFSDGYVYRISANKEVQWDFMANNEVGGFSDPPTSIRAMPDGNFLFAGAFTNYDQSVVGSIIKLNEWGVIDEEFLRNSGVGFNDEVKDIFIDENGDVIAVGAFDNYNGTYAPGIVKIKSNGKVDESFNPVSVNGIINKVHVQPETGEITIGGDFKIDGTDIQYFTKLNSKGKLTQ